MFKKCLVASLFIVFTPPVFAITPAPYAGFAFGLNNTYWTLQNPLSGKTNFNGNGKTLKLLGGISALLAPTFSMAGEVFVSDTSTQTGTRALDDNGLNASARETYSYGLSVLPGYLLTPDTTLYARLGLVRAHFEINTKPGNSANDTITGGQTGVGLALALSKNLSLRGEYNYNFYQTYNALNYSIASNASQLSVAFVYKFI